MGNLKNTSSGQSCPRSNGNEGVLSKFPKLEPHQQMQFLCPALDIF